MTLNVTVPDAVYRQIVDLAARQQVSGGADRGGGLGRTTFWLGPRGANGRTRRSRTFPGRAGQGSSN